MPEDMSRPTLPYASRAPHFHRRIGSAVGLFLVGVLVGSLISMYYNSTGPEFVGGGAMATISTTGTKSAATTTSSSSASSATGAFVETEAIRKSSKLFPLPMDLLKQNVSLAAAYHDTVLRAKRAVTEDNETDPDVYQQQKHGMVRRCDCTDPNAQLDCCHRIVWRSHKMGTYCKRGRAEASYGPYSIFSPRIFSKIYKLCQCYCVPPYRRLRTQFQVGRSGPS